jgi:hypothetical protein
MTAVSRKRPLSGYALCLVMVFTAVGMIALTGAMTWTRQNARLIERYNRYNATLFAAEAATEKVLANLMMDYKIGGDAAVYNNLATYRAMVPTTAETAMCADYQFSNARGTDNETYVERVAYSTSAVPLESQYAGLSGFASTYRIISNVRYVNSDYRMTNAVQQDVQVATIPVFQFAIFYAMDLELNTQTVMEILGRVHSNGAIFLAPSAGVTFLNDVTSVGRIIRTRKPGDPSYSSTLNTTTVNFRGQRNTNVASLTLPIGTSNTSAAVHKVVETPPGDEDPASQLGKQRYYNKAELQIIIRDTNALIVAIDRTLGVSNTIPWTNVTAFLSTNATFYDQRESKTVRATQIDVGKFNAWAATNSVIGNTLGNTTPPKIIFVDDQRTVSGAVLNAVRLTNGMVLPAGGFTVATPNPLYVLGNYNSGTNASTFNSTNTTMAKPASLVADALTVLSQKWQDSKSTNSYTDRAATNTSVNAAILTGIVATTNSPSRYSGGVHNLGRFLEDWDSNSSTITYNGSMVVMFESQKATGAFQQPGAYYEPPKREFYFDQSYFDVAKQPPGTPELRALIRGKWLNPPVNNVTWTQVTY